MPGKFEMNLGRSSDSLDNDHDDIVCSGSSCSDFTSDDETNNDQLFLMSGQSLSKPRARGPGDVEQPNKADKYQTTQNYRPNYYHPIQSRYNTNASAVCPMLESNEHLTNPVGYLNNCSVNPTLRASTSYYNEPTLSSRIPDLVRDSSTIALTPDRHFVRRCNNQIENVNSHRSLIRNRRTQSHRAGHSSNSTDLENGENVGILMGGEDDDVDLFVRNDPQLEPSVPIISSSSRGMNTIAVRMCSRLVESRSLLEAIEFIDQNRDLIESLTRIVREAPAFRNYEISNYQIDYSVKESFNPNFWHDREPIVTTADGNCQYHAVSMSLTGSEAYTPEVRLATAVAVVDNREWFDAMLKLIDRGTVLDLVHTIARNYSWGDETTLKAIAVAINRRIFLYTCNIGKKDYEMVKSLSKEELLDAFKEKKYRGGTGIHTYADPLIHVPSNNYIMLFHKSEHFIAVLSTCQQLTMFEPYNPIVPVFS